MSPEKQCVVVLCACPEDGTGARIAQVVVEEALAACVNRIPGVVSTFRWEGKVREDGEVLLVIKTTAARVDALSRRIRELHPYELPEVLAVPVSRGLAEYLAWVGESVA